MKYDCYENDTFNLYTIETNKFKSVHVEVVFRTPATKENMTYLAILVDQLLENSKKYPTRKLFARKLADLYNANIYASNTRVGGMIISNFILDFLDPKYTSKEMLDESIELLFDVILNPNVDVGEFEEKTFERLKDNLKKEIESLKEDPKQSSILEALRRVSKDDIRSLNSCGDMDVLQGITPKKLYSFYQNFLENSMKDVYIIGNLDMKQVDKAVRRYAKFKSISHKKDKIYLEDLKVKSLKDAARESELSQTNLVQVYSLVDLTQKELDYVMPLFNMIVGSGSLESKIYKALRGENSLCYNVTTFYQKYDKTLLLHTAIDDSSTKLALKLIKGCFNDMTKGNISDEELESVKNMMISSLYLILDSPNRLVDMYLFKNIARLPDIEARIDAIREVKKSDLVNLAKKIKLTLTYRVRGNR